MGLKKTLLRIYYLPCLSKEKANHYQQVIRDAEWDSFNDYIPLQSKLLDVGCGAGYNIKKAKEESVERELSKEKVEKELEPIARFPSPKNLKWEEVNVTFVSNETLEIRARGIIKKYNFAQLGFQDSRKVDSPNTLWRLLKDYFASEYLEIAWERSNLPLDLMKNMQKRVSRLRKHLKEIMGIEEDPFSPYREVRAYSPKFSIRDQTLPGAGQVPPTKQYSPNEKHDYEIQQLIEEETNPRFLRD